MAAQQFGLEFDGYWREPNKSAIPAKAGVYAVYTATYNAASKTVSIHRLIYIGKAENARERVAGHERWEDWRAERKTGQTICISFAPVSADSCERAEAACIFHHKPPLNTEYKDRFPFDQTIVRTSGKSSKMKEYFVVRRR